MSGGQTAFFITTSGGYPTFGTAQVGGTAPSFAFTGTTWGATNGGAFQTGTLSSLMLAQVGAPTWVDPSIPPGIPPLGGALTQGTFAVVNGSNIIVPTNVGETLTNGTRVEFLSQSGTYYYIYSYNAITGNYQITTSATGGAVGSYSGTSNAATDLIIHLGFADSFRTATTLTQTFPAATWAISLSVQTETASASGSGTFNIRIWKGTAADGSNAVEQTGQANNGEGLTTTSFSWTTADSGVQQYVTTTWAGQSITCTGEYLFFQIGVVHGPSGSTDSASLYLYQDGLHSFILSNNSPTVSCSGVKNSPVKGVALVTVKTQAAGAVKSPVLGVQDNLVKTFSSGVTKNSVPGVGEGFAGLIIDAHGVIKSPVLGVAYVTVESFNSGVTKSPVLGVQDNLVKTAAVGETAHPVLGIAANTVIVQGIGVTKHPALGVGRPEVYANGHTVSPVNGTPIFDINCAGVTKHPVLGAAYITVQTQSTGEVAFRKNGIGYPEIAGTVYGTGVTKSPVLGTVANTLKTQSSGVTKSPVHGIAYLTVVVQGVGAVKFPQLGIQDCQVETFSSGVTKSPVHGIAYLTVATQGIGEHAEAVPGVPKSPTSNGFGAVVFAIPGIQDCRVIPTTHGVNAHTNVGLPYIHVETFAMGTVVELPMATGQARIVSRVSVLDVLITLT